MVRGTCGGKREKDRVIMPPVRFSLFDCLMSARNKQSVLGSDARGQHWMWLRLCLYPTWHRLCWSLPKRVTKWCSNLQYSIPKCYCIGISIHLQSSQMYVIILMFVYIILLRCLLFAPVLLTGGLCPFWACPHSSISGSPTSMATWLSLGMLGWHLYH